MKSIFLSIVVVMLLSTCSTKKGCDNRFDFINANDTIPILHLDYAESFDARLQRMENLYGNDLCAHCGLLEFKTPFDLDGKKGYFKVLFDFDYPYCSHCPLKMVERNYFEILVNESNEILAEQKFISLDSLQTEIHNTLNEYVNNINDLESFKRFRYSLKWDKKVDAKFMDSVLLNINLAHISFVEQMLLENGKNFCSLNKMEINKLQSSFPIRIVLPTGKQIEMFVPSLPNELTKSNDEN